MEPALKAIYEAARGYRGVPHGDTETGEVDIEFPDVFRAASFARYAVEPKPGAPLALWADIRANDAVQSLRQSVVLTVIPNPAHPGKGNGNGA